MNKAIVTGSTGGIGGATTRLLREKGWQVSLPVRSSQKAIGIFGDDPALHIDQCDLSNEEDMERYAKELKSKSSMIELVVLAAGGRGPEGEFYDWEFVGETAEDRQKNSSREHIASSVLTKKTIVSALYKVYGSNLKETTLVLIGSHAADFSPELALKYSEVGYSAGMKETRLYAKELEKQDIFKKVILLEPGLVRTDLTTEKLSDALSDPNSTVIEREDYAVELLSKTGLF